MRLRGRVELLVGLSEKVGRELIKYLQALLRSPKVRFYLGKVPNCHAGSQHHIAKNTLSSALQLMQTPLSS